MNYWDKKVIREQLDKRLDNRLRHQLHSEIGWIKVIREALGMTASQLARRVGIDQSRISRIENNEMSGDVKLSSMQKIADGLGMKFVYAFIPHQTLEEMVREQATKMAKRQIALVNKTMRLEDQELSLDEKAKAFDDLVQKILIDDPKGLWDE